MNEELRAFYVELGMPVDLSDADAIRWGKENLKRSAAPGGNSNPAPPAEPAAGNGNPAPATRAAEPFDAEKLAADIAARVLKTTTEALDKRDAERIAFRKEIDATCLLAEVPVDKDRYYGAENLEKFRELVLEDKKNRAADIYASPRVSVVGSSVDTTRAALSTAFLTRALTNCNANEARMEELLPKAERSPHAKAFKHAGALDIARECLQLDGFNTRGMSRENIAIAALGWPHQAGIRAAFDPAYHVTGSFPKLTQDAMSKSMMIGYQEFPATWRICFRQGESTNDFKMIHRLRMGAIPNLPDWPDNMPLEVASLADAEETYRVELKSLKISFSYRLLVNDDMSMVSRIPMMFGDAASRTVNALAWAQITANPTMSDGQALFLETPAGNRKRKNLTTGTASPTVATRQILTSLMRLMRGENTPEGNEGPDVLNLEPAYIAGPTAIETNILQLVNSAYDPAASQFMTYNPARTLTPIIEPLLDAASATAFYLFAGQNRIDTVEVTFLTGHESPVVRNWADPETLAQNAAVLQGVGAKALNHRGMQKHAGA